MALDGVTLAYLAAELAPQLVGARIDKIQQPEKEEIHFLLRSGGRSLRLLFNVGANSARLQLTQTAKKNPLSPPMFCMMMRKYLEGGRILALEQSGLERILTMRIETYNEYGDLASYHLYLEIMGKHSNLILVDPVDQTILDGMKRYSHALSRHREVLPGRAYILPPSQGKLEGPLTDEEFHQALLRTGQEEKPSWDRALTKVILERFGGISPELGKEIILQAGLPLQSTLSECGEIDLNRLYQAYLRLACPTPDQRTEPCVYYDPHQPSVPVAFSFLPFEQYLGLNAQRAATLNDALVLFYESRAQSNVLESTRGSLLKRLNEHGDHLRRKLSLYEDTLADSEGAMIYQLWGELLMANLYRLPGGQSSVQLEDYNRPDYPMVDIPLEPDLNGIENAKRYYRLYNKAKTTRVKTEPLKQAVLAELNYLESVELSLTQARTLAELKEIHAEMAEQGYLAGKGKEKGHGEKSGKEKGGNSKNNKKESPEPRVFRSAQGRIILVGKNNKQNDWLTMKYGSPQDLWLHVKNIPGSHVLIPLEAGEEFPDDQTLEEAAALAIHFSQARESTLVPVDYTHVKNVKKPNAAKPGMVIYDKNWTVYLTPERTILDRLLSGEETQ